MSEDLPGPDSLWDVFLEDAEGFDFDAYVGEPPEWYFPLVGRVAVATGGLERRVAMTAVHLTGWPPGPGAHLTFWLHSTARLQALLDAVKGLNPDFDRLVRKLPAVREERNRIVHVSTGWHTTKVRTSRLAGTTSIPVRARQLTSTTPPRRRTWKRHSKRSWASTRQCGSCSSR